MSFEQKRTLQDSKKMNYYDRLRLQMQKERTRINSSPIIRKYNFKGSINHEKAQITTKKKKNYHTYTLNHSD